MALTQLTPSGIPGQRYGSFAGKAADAGHGPHNPGTITQLMPFGAPGGLYGNFAGKEESAAPEPQPVVQSSGGRVKKRAERYALKVDDKWLIFSSWDELEEYLESLKQEELEESAEKVEKAVNRILRTGKAPKKAPRIVIQSASKEVREQVDLLNAEIERVFWMKVHEELSARADEEDIEILLGVI